MRFMFVVLSTFKTTINRTVHVRSVVLEKRRFDFVQSRSIERNEIIVGYVGITWFNPIDLKSDKNDLLIVLYMMPKWKQL